jgi:5-methylthioadenosine/S-adenosylhomocysteine deaminase
MTHILLRHADVITLGAEGRVLRDAEIAIADGLIVAVGAAPAGFAADETVDCRHHVVMPGFFNAHTHSPTTLLRGRGSRLPVARLFNPRWSGASGWEGEVGLTAEDVYWGAALAAVEMIRSGTVGFADHFFFMDQVARVVVESGLRASLAWCTFGREMGEIGADLSGIAAFVDRWQGAAGGRIKTLLGPHSPYACTPQFLARTAAVAARLGVGIHLHLAETQAQVDESLTRYDLTPVELLDRNGVLDGPVLAAHGIYLSDADRAILAARDVTVVQCPTTNMRLGLGVTDVTALLTDGAPVALGTDSVMTGGSLDMLTEARHASLMQTLHWENPDALPGDLPLRLATQHGARALGFATSGEISPGHAADLILLDCNNARLRLRHDLVAGVLHAGERADVSDVLVAGRWLMRERRLLTLDEARILAEAERRVGG